MQRVAIDIPFQGLERLFRDADLARLEHRASWSGSVLAILDHLDQIWLSLGSPRTTARIRDRINASQIEKTHRHLSNALEIVDALYQLEQLLSEYQAETSPSEIVATSRRLASCLSLTTDLIEPHGPAIQRIFDQTTAQSIIKPAHRAKLISSIALVIGAIAASYDRKWSGVYQISICHGSAPSLVSYQQFAITKPNDFADGPADQDDDQIIAKLLERETAQEPRFRISSSAQDCWFQLASSGEPNDLASSLAGTDYKIRVTNLPEKMVCTY
jgi:hypothetical protein